MKFVRTPTFWFAAGVLVIWCIQLYVASSSDDVANRGTLGDAFGAINALFSGLAFVGLIYAILLQREELALQRKELQDTRVELRGTREAQERQNSFIEQQTFEGTLFQLLRTLADIIESIDLRDEVGRTTKGRDAIAAFYRRLDREVVRHRRELPNSDELSLIRAAYEDFYRQNSHELGHYFRMFYNVIKLIDRSEIADKRRYSQIVRAQMSDLEANLQLYNCLTDRAVRMRHLVEKYHLLKYINDDRLLGAGHRSFFPPSAFADE